jgi:hypothetical protein
MPTQENLASLAKHPYFDVFLSYNTNRDNEKQLYIVVGDGPSKKDDKFINEIKPFKIDPDHPFQSPNLFRYGCYLYPKDALMKCEKGN